VSQSTRPTDWDLSLTLVEKSLLVNCRELTKLGTQIRAIRCSTFLTACQTAASNTECLAGCLILFVPIAMASVARGADLTPTPFAAVVLDGSRKRLLGGGFKSAGAAGGRSLRSPRAPDARAALGRRRRGRMRTPRGPGADRAIRSRAEKCAAAAAGETQGRNQSPAATAIQNA
jgi:hypothetical protein